MGVISKYDTSDEEDRWDENGNHLDENGRPDGGGLLSVEMDNQQARVLRKALSDNLKSWEELKAIDLEIVDLHRRYKDLMARVQSSIRVFHQLFEEEGR